MKTEIIRITESNLHDHLDDFILLMDEFLTLMGSESERSRAEKRGILDKMVRSGSPTVVLLVVSENGGPAGVSYYNYGSGYSSGGAYLWLNCIYVRSEHQAKGIGSRLLAFIEEDGRKNGIKLLTCNRHVENVASRRFFNRAGFKQVDRMLMKKTYDWAKGRSG